MTARSALQVGFGLAGLYDGLLGVIFLLFPATVFARFHVTPPNHYGYVQFSAAVLIVFALMFFAVMGAPVRNRNLIPYGILLKVSYCGVVFVYWFTQGLPSLWKPFAVLDAVWAVFFLWAWRSLPASVR